MFEEKELTSEVKLIDKLTYREDDNAEQINVKVKRTKYRWYQINREVLPAKFSYFCEGGRLVSNDAMLGLFLTGIGLTKPEVGFVLGTG